MPRLTNTAYLVQRERLIKAFNIRPSLFTALSYNDQLDLHAFYALHQEWIDQDLLAHRAQVTKEHPSLPHRAGKLYARINRQLQNNRPHQPLPPTGTSTSKRVKVPGSLRQSNIRIEGLAHPVPDYQKLAKALIDHLEAERKAKILKAAQRAEPKTLDQSQGDDRMAA